MATTCNCCGCVIVDGTTSVVGGSGSSGDPFEIDIIDPDFSTERYAVRRQRSSTQSIPNDTITAIDFTTAVPSGSFDRGPFFSAVTPTLFTIPTSGIYIVGGTVSWADNAVGTRYIEIIKNLTTVVTSFESNSNAGSVHFVSTSSSAPLYSGETLSMRVRQVSGGLLDVTVSAEQSPVFWAVYVGRFV